MTQSVMKRKRSCVSCSQQDSKDLLHRFVRRADGTVAFDESGRAPGRGAYVCSVECLKKAQKTGKLGRALRVSMNEADYNRIAEELSASLAAASTKDEE